MHLFNSWGKLSGDIQLKRVQSIGQISMCLDQYHHLSFNKIQFNEHLDCAIFHHLANSVTYSRLCVCVIMSVNNWLDLNSNSWWHSSQRRLRMEMLSTPFLHDHIHQTNCVFWMKNSLCFVFEKIWNLIIVVIVHSRISCDKYFQSHLFIRELSNAMGLVER